VGEIIKLEGDNASI